MRFEEIKKKQLFKRQRKIRKNEGEKKYRWEIMKFEKNIYIF